MKSKNSFPLTPRERDHLERVKALSCSWCNGAGGFAHHIRQGCHWLCVATCHACHQGPQGVHGDQTMIRLTGLDEWAALNITHQRLAGDEPRTHSRQNSTRTPSKIVPRAA